MSKPTKWLLIILAAIVLLSLGFVGGYFIMKKSKNEPAKTKEPPKTEETQDSSSSDENVSEEEAQYGEGWNIFKNLSQKYLIEYPEGAAVENGSGTEGEKDKPANESACVTIGNDYVWVTIAGRFIADDAFCMRTGFGTEWGNAPDEQVTAAGQEYTATGMYTSSASAGYYQDHYYFEVVSGEKISYGITVNEKLDGNMTKAQAKELVHKILASFSPAE
ncbi:hypothetical protein A2V71_03085 [Candidatus Berkelbacteria bacterium RBG_13_40_8]|uniref:DUF4367 domain-containing protein n=1 Tax=Candidatus Berkelbacteria bacterium RBG_13_40_8 TaxID=1797467 RepID=A0A1F5DP47_9BACT|nr:MAG: hypothetical protein A2V71_03085 [Candidatus Berkelbacteria bacterium RBG_13_40_8]